MITQINIEDIEKDEKQLNGEREIFDYCCYTKKPIYVGDEYHCKNGQYYSVEGWKQEIGLIDEIIFDES